MLKFDLFSCGTNSDVSFSLFFPDGPNGEDCDRLDTFDEGVEFAFRLSSAQMEWIPIAFIFPAMSRRSDNLIPIGTLGNLSLRGYSLEMDQAVLLERGCQQKFNYTLCAPQLPEFDGSGYIQFRWLQTDSIYTSNNHRDVWSLDNVTIDFVNMEGMSCMMLDESFESNSLK